MTHRDRRWVRLFAGLMVMSVIPVAVLSLCTTEHLTEGAVIAAFLVAIIVSAAGAWLLNHRREFHLRRVGSRIEGLKSRFPGIELSSSTSSIPATEKSIAGTQNLADEPGSETDIPPIDLRNPITMSLETCLEGLDLHLSRYIANTETRRSDLQRRNDQLQTVLSAMVEGVIAVNRDERVLLANAAGIRLLQLPEQGAEGCLLWEYARHQPLQAVVKQALGGTPDVRLEFELLRTHRTLSVTASPLQGSPPPGAVLVLEDVTELRRLERLRRDFVANVSHELKTPLTSISAYTETLLDGAYEEPELCHQFLGHISEQSERLHRLIVDLLMLARMDAGEETYDLTEFDARTVIAESVAAHQGVARAKQIALDYHQPEEPLLISADPDGLGTIIDNLLDNALNYTPESGRVTTRLDLRENCVVLTVQDTGIGIAREHQTRIFERFYRADRARSRDVGGTGLGLAIVKHLCQMFRGEITVVSQLERGSTFTVKLPCASSVESVSVLQLSRP